MDPVLLVKTVIVFTLLLGVLVVFHEWGHYTAAKLLRIKVYEFAFGFGPIIARLFKRDGTEFNVRIVPLGGFVRIAGMDPGEENAEDAANGFNSRPAWQRAAVILAGPFMSLVLGYIVFLMIGFVWGFAGNESTTRVGAVSAKSPAARAGFQVGDNIIAIDGKPVRDGSEVREITSQSAGKQLTFEIRRDSRMVDLKAVPELNEKAVQVGIILEPVMERTGIVESIKKGTEQTIRAVSLIIKTLFSKKIGENVGGIVMIGYVTGEMVKAGPYNVFFELALLSVMLGIINLVPWPLLDGGHILYIIVEKIRGKKLDPEKWYAIQMIGMAVLIFLAVFLVYFDISRIASGDLPQ